MGESSVRHLIDYAQSHKFIERFNLWFPYGKPHVHSSTMLTCNVRFLRHCFSPTHALCSLTIFHLFYFFFTHSHLTYDTMTNMMQRNKKCTYNMNIQFQFNVLCLVILLTPTPTETLLIIFKIFRNYSEQL